MHCIGTQPGRETCLSIGSPLVIFNRRAQYFLLDNTYDYSTRAYFRYYLTNLMQYLHQVQHHTSSITSRKQTLSRQRQSIHLLVFPPPVCCSTRFENKERLQTHANISGYSITEYNILYLLMIVYNYPVITTILVLATLLVPLIDSFLNHPLSSFLHADSLFCMQHCSIVEAR